MTSNRETRYSFDIMTSAAWRRASRRGVLKGVAAASLAAAGTSFVPRRSFARQGVSGDVNLRFFPFGPGVEDLYAQFKDEFQKENPGANVILDLQPWDNRYPKMLADLAAGTGPDVMFITTDVLIRFSQANAIKALNDVVSADTWEGYSDATIAQVSLDDQKWYTPMDQELPIWLCNKDLLSQAGLDPENPPYTWDELSKMNAAVKEKTNGASYGMGYTAGSPTINLSFYPFLYQAGGRPISEDGKSPTFNSGEGVAALTYIVNLFKEGYAPQEYLQPVTDDSNPFTLGQVAISNQMSVNGMKGVQKAEPDFEFGIVPVLKDKEQWGFGGMRSWAMSAKPRSQDAAAAMLEFLVRPENMIRHCSLSGTFPIKSNAMETAAKDDPTIDELKPRLEFTFGEQKHKYGRDLMPLVVPEIQGAILGQKTPQQALDDAAKAVQELFDKG